MRLLKFLRKDSVLDWAIDDKIAHVEKDVPDQIRKVKEREQQAEDDQMKSWLDYERQECFRLKSEGKLDSMDCDMFDPTSMLDMMKSGNMGGTPHSEL